MFRDMMPIKNCFVGKGTTGVWQGILVSKEKKSPVLLCAMMGAANTVAGNLPLADRLELTGPWRLQQCLEPDSDAAFIGYNPVGSDPTIRSNTGKIISIETHVTRTQPHWANYSKFYE